MKNIIFSFFVFLSLIGYCQTDNEQLTQAKNVASEVVQHLSNKSYIDLNQLFSSNVKEQLTVEKLKGIFSGLNAQYGAIQGGLDFHQKVTAEAIYYEQGIAFEKEKFTLLFTLNEENKMQAFRLTPYTPKYEWNPPSYAVLDNLTETSITIEGEMPLQGKLTTPKLNKHEVVVVFVHGSGPNDMNESLGPNKLFKDLAYGLASNGIASIRYNKVSYDYPSSLAKRMNSITIQDLVVNDAVAAIQQAKKMNAKKVILLGHSLGGYMAPMIANKESVDGVILMAGNVSPLHELLIPQYEHIMKNDSTSTIGEFQLNAIKAQVKNIEDDNYNANTPSMTLPLGLPASFWTSLKDYSPLKVAKKQTQPYFILNGDRDYQVTVNEAKKWKNGNKHKKSKTIIYPKLNHMFFAGEGIPIPSEYEKKGHLNEQTLNDIINWSNSL